MPVFQLPKTRKECKHEKRRQCASETVTNKTTGEVKVTTYMQCENCGHITAKVTQQRKPNG